MMDYHTVQRPESRNTTSIENRQTKGRHVAPYRPRSQLQLLNCFIWSPKLEVKLIEFISVIVSLHSRIFSHIEDNDGDYDGDEGSILKNSITLIYF